MLSHMFRNAVNILKETDMTELIYFIIADCLYHHLLFNILKVIGGSCQCCYTGTRKTDFGSRTEFIYHIRIARALTFRKNLHQIVLIDII